MNMTNIAVSQLYHVQMPTSLPEWLSQVLITFAYGFSAILLLLILIIFVFFVRDITQTKDTIRRNYPVLGRFRHWFSELGTFFRQYFFALDRQEMPFNRAERDWIEQVSEDGSLTVPFGSTRRLEQGSVIFANGMFPKLKSEHKIHVPKIIGKNSPKPYQPKSYFNISAMSYGSLSKPAIRALSHGANRGECWLNTGEGGISPYHLEGGCDLIYQLGTAKFGARKDDGGLDADRLAQICHDHPQIKMIELKLSQGAKPGKGGILPAIKVTDEISKIRGIPVGQDAISPNRHPEAANANELLDLIDQVRRTSKLPTGIKLVIGEIGDFEAFIAAIIGRGIQSAPDFITLDGGDGGTGAAPMPLMDNMGLTIRQSLPLVIDLLTNAGVRDDIRIIATGKLITPAEIAWAFCAGADFVSSARGFMFSLGCIQALKCNTNTCPTGITTHDPRLQKGLDPHNKSVRVQNFIKTVQTEVEMIAHSCGVDHPNQLKRHHALVLGPDNKAQSFDQLYPISVTKAD